MPLLSAPAPLRAAAIAVLVCGNEFLKGGIGTQWVPFPAKLQIVHGDAVVHAVDRAGRAKQPLDQRDRELVLADPRVDERETTIHDRAVVGVFRFRLQLDRPPAFSNGIFFSAHEGITQSEVRMPLGVMRGFFHRALKDLASGLEISLGQLRVAQRDGRAAGQEAFRGQSHR